MLSGVCAVTAWHTSFTYLYVSTETLLIFQTTIFVSSSVTLLPSNVTGDRGTQLLLWQSLLGERRYMKSKDWLASDSLKSVFGS